MPKLTKIDPKNLTAQLQHRSVGNPPQTHPSTAVGNFFPGLEFNFQNVWKRIFIGIDLLEYGGQVIALNEAELADMPPAEIAKLRQVVGGFLASVDGQELAVDVRGPAPGSPDVVTLGQLYLEWSNALAKLHAKKGGTRDTAACIFTLTERTKNGTREVRTEPIHLKVRRLIVPDTALISREANEPGEITESLCSPWQTDYIGCACYYWASNRPDYVNIDSRVDGNGAERSVGHNWLNTTRDSGGGDTPIYTLDEQRLLQHEDVMQGWEHKFHFIIKSRDAPDGVVTPSKEES